jgi:hypothetical protein
MLMAAVAGYALYQNMTGDPGLTAMDEAQRLTRIDQTQAIPGKLAADYGLQVTLNYAYADANRIVVSYTLSAESEADTPIFVSNNPTLTVANDSHIPRMLLGSYGTPETATTKDGRLAYTATMVSNFDATTFTPESDTVKLTLDVETALSFPKSDNPYRMELAEQAHFEFSVPFDPGRTMDTPQTIEHGGLALTLQKVVVAPSLTRLEMCYADPAPEGRAWAVYGQLDVNGTPVVENAQLNETGPNGESLDEAEPCHTLIIPAALDKQSGEWRLTITHMQLPGSENPQQVVAQMKEQFGIDIQASEYGGYTPDPMDANTAKALASVLKGLQQRIDGPWVFTFTVPQ